MSFLKSDAAKIIGACIGAICTALIGFFPPPNTVGTVAALVVSLLASLGIVSGGTSGAQPANVVTKPPDA